MADGITAVVVGAWARWWSLFVFGLLGIAAGLFALFRPATTALALLIVIAAWAIARGILEVIAAIRLRKEIAHEWLLALSGLVSIAFGVLLAVFPGAGALSMIWLIGAYALVVGVVFLILAFRLRGVSHRFEPHPAV